MSSRVAFALALLAGGIATARSGAAADCADAMSQPEINDCEYNIYRQANGRLNRVYAQLSARHDPAETKMLREAKRAWLEFRDKECAFETVASARGSIRPMLVSQCLAALTNRLIRELEIQRDCKEDLCAGR